MKTPDIIHAVPCKASGSEHQQALDLQIAYLEPRDSDMPSCKWFHVTGCIAPPPASTTENPFSKWIKVRKITE